MHTVVELEQFNVSAKKANLTAEELNSIITFLSRNPTAGVVLSGTGGARKFRFRGRGKGTSGGYRVVTYYTGIDIPVFLIDIFAKGDRIDLTQKERNSLRVILSQVAAAYRRSSL